jgi:hypothetical protein
MTTYIQKKINGKWGTILTIVSSISNSAHNHLCKEYCRGLYRISTERTTDMPSKLQGLSEKDILETLLQYRNSRLT